MAQISVIIPVYNVEPYLRRCLDSVLLQTYDDFEIVLVNDGSKDNCGHICDEYARLNKIIKVIHQSNAGLSAARNAGIDWVFKNSTSKYFAFIDSDDWVDQYYLEALYKGVAKGVKFSSVGFRYVREGDQLGPELEHDEIKILSVEDFWICGKTIESTAWGKLYARELFENVRFPIGKLHEDQLVAHKVLFQTDKMAFADAKLYRYFVRPTSIMGMTWTIRRLDRIDAWLQEIEFFEKKGLKKHAERSRFSLLFDCVEALEHLRGGATHPEETVRCRNLGGRMLRELRVNWITGWRCYSVIYPFPFVWKIAAALDAVTRVGPIFVVRVALKRMLRR